MAAKKRRAEWIRVDCHLPRHPKSVRLASALGEEGAWRYVVTLWCYAVHFELGDDLSGLSHQEIAQAAEYRGDAEAFVAALLATRWIDREDLLGGLRLHEFRDYNGRYVEDNRRRADEAGERMRTLRALDRMGRPGTPGDAVTTAPTASAGTPAPSEQDAVLANEGRTAPCSGEQGANSDQFGRTPTPARGGAPSCPVSSRLESEVRRESEQAADAGPTGNPELDDFVRWWSAYPATTSRPSSRLRAWEAWLGSSGARPAVESMRRRLEIQKASSGWRVEGGRYIPKAENYLRDARWLDVGDPGEAAAPREDVEPQAFDQEAVVAVRLRRLAELLPAEQRDEFGGRVLLLEHLDELTEIEKRLGEVQRDLEAAVELSLSDAEADELARQVRVGLSRFEATLPEGALKDLRRRFRQQGLRRLRAVPLLSLFAPEVVNGAQPAAEDAA